MTAECFCSKVCITLKVFAAVGLVGTIILLACGIWKVRHVIFGVYPHLWQEYQRLLMWHWLLAPNTFEIWLKPEHGSCPAYPHWNFHHVSQELLPSIWKLNISPLYMHIFIHVCVQVYKCIYIYTYVCVCVVIWSLVHQYASRSLHEHNSWVSSRPSL